MKLIQRKLFWILKINKLDTDLSLEEINAKILPIKDSINEIESEILQIDRDLGNQTREYASIRSAAETVALNAYNASMGAISESEAQSGKGNIQNWTSDLQRTEDERKEKEKIKKQLEKELDEIGTIGLGLREKKDRKKASITEIKNEINDLKVKEKEIKIKIEKSNTDLSGTASASRNQAENIYKKALEDAKSQYDLSIEPASDKSKKVSKAII